MFNTRRWLQTWCHKTGEGFFALMIAMAIIAPAMGQTPAKPAGQAPATGGAAKKPGVGQAAPAPAAPQSKHYPILLIASGTNPVWSVRIGMKGAERLERVEAVVGVKMSLLVLAAVCSDCHSSPVVNPLQMESQGRSDSSIPSRMCM